MPAAADDISKASLARGAGVALWRQIAGQLEAEIAALPPATRLPTEAELASRFAVNRHTVRRALEALAGQGLIRVEHGRGSFVAEDVLAYRLGSRTRFSELVRQQQREPAGQVLSMGRIPAPPLVAELLRLQPGTAVLRVERLSLVDGRPLVLGQHHFPLPRFSGMPALLAQNASVTAALAGCGVADYRRQLTRITARMPSAQEAALLQQGHAQPVLATEALDVDREGRPVDAKLSLYAAARMQLVVEGERP